ncbi:MAG: helix-turn-helix domain-containing protein [Bacteroidales bacterium]|nr:helix-turn-helix domain-containing protein [Bacteroidales bacterium]
MEQQTKKLNQTIEERKKLINVLSHDLNNPLFSVIGSSDGEMTHLTHDEVVEMIEDKSVWEENTVLIVDKDEKTRLEIKEMLSDYFHVIDTSDGTEAVNVADSQLPDIIVSDMDKSELSMAEMAKQLYASERTKHIPILFVSSKNDAVDRLLGLLCGAIDYVAKPFSQLELLLKLTNILKVRQEHQKLIMQASISTRMKEHTMNKDDVEKDEIHPFLQAFMEKVSECYTDSTMTVDGLAGKLAVSKATLTRKVKSMTGKTPMEWLMEYRLNCSFQILQNSNSDKTISEVAYEVGFNDPSYFTKKFRDYYGFLPSQIGEKKK